MGVALVDDRWVLGLGVGLGVQLFRLLICLLLIDLVLVVIIRPWCFFGEDWVFSFSSLFKRFLCCLSNF